MSRRTGPSARTHSATISRESRPLDAFYFTLITSSTVGYGDITPNLGSIDARLFTMSVLVLGVSSFGLAAGVLLGPAIQARITKTLGIMTESELELLSDHVLVLGYGELTEPIVDELADNDREFVVVTSDNDASDALSDTTSRSSWLTPATRLHSTAPRSSRHPQFWSRRTRTHRTH